MKHIILVFLLIIGISACSKEDENFKLKTVTLTAYKGAALSQQRIYIKIVDAADTARVVGKSASYPSDLSLPATLGLESAVKQPFYKNTCYVQLWGDTDGMISSVKVNMDKYKIIFPLAMEVGNEVFEVTLSGSWD